MTTRTRASRQSSSLVLDDGKRCDRGLIRAGLKVHILSPGADMTRVLIVDDDPLVCAAIEICLERHDGGGFSGVVQSN